MIKLENIQKHYGKKTVIDALTLSIPEGARFALTAPSGCGKTTLLHIIAGLVKPDGGSVSGILPGDICMLFQEGRLFSRFSALENVMAVLKGSQKEKREKFYFISL